MNFLTKKNKKDSRKYAKGHYINLLRKGGTKNQTWIIRDEIIKEIRNSKKNILLSLNHFNIKEIAIALLEAVKKGIDVKLFVDNQEYKTSLKHKEMTPLFVFQWKKMQQNELKDPPVRVKYYSHAPFYGYWRLNHHKFIIFDYDEKDFSKTTLISGSYNLSKNAEHRQFDNVIVYKGRDKENLYRSFKDEFNNLWKLNRDEEDKPEEAIYSKFLILEKNSLPLHLNESISLTWKEIKSLRDQVKLIAKDFFKSIYRNRNCRYYSVVENRYWGCLN